MKRLIFVSWIVLCAVLLSAGVIAAVPGDINGDGALANDDLSVLVRYLSGHPDAVKLANLDVDANDRINNRDAIRLAQALAGWQVTVSSSVGRDGTDIPVSSLR